MAYSAEERKAVQDRLCRMIAAGLSVKKACAIDGMPSESTVFEWLYDDEAFSEQYARARERRADARAERIDDIAVKVEAGDLKPDAARVIIDAEKWQAGKENAKRYGDRLNLDADISLNISDEQVEARLAHLLGKAGASGAPRGEGEA